MTDNNYNCIILSYLISLIVKITYSNHGQEQFEGHINALRSFPQTFDFELTVFLIVKCSSLCFSKQPPLKGHALCSSLPVSAVFHAEQRQTITIFDLDAEFNVCFYSTVSVEMFEIQLFLGGQCLSMVLGYCDRSYGLHQRC